MKLFRTLLSIVKVPTFEFGAKTIAELREENAKLFDIVRIQTQMIRNQADSLVETDGVKKADDGQKVVPGMELRETKNELEIVNEKIERVKAFLEICRV